MFKMGNKFNYITNILFVVHSNSVPFLQDIFQPNRCYLYNMKIVVTNVTWKRSYIYTVNTSKLAIYVTSLSYRQYQLGMTNICVWYAYKATEYYRSLPGLAFLCKNVFIFSPSQNLFLNSCLWTFFTNII